MTEMVQTSHDALSRLIQLQSNRHEIRLVWSGKGINDLVELVRAHAAHARRAKHLWNGMRDLMAMRELRELPEPLQAQIASIILKAQVMADLEAEAHVQRLAAEKSKGST